MRELTEEAKQLQELIKQIPRAYYDIIEGVPRIMQQRGQTKEMIEFITNTPNVTTSDVVKYLDWLDDNATPQK